MEIKYGFMQITYVGENPIQCADVLCSRDIQPEDTCLVDVEKGGAVYCKLCGPCERYHRKKSTERENP